MVYFGIVWLVFSAWVHYYYAGVYSGPLWISTYFGISEQSIAAGARPVFEAPMAGWDGQFYYTQSNDPLLLDDYSKSTLIDNVSYRFQRNALPFFAWCAGKLIGAEHTSPRVFFLTQILITSCGFGALVSLLLRRGIHPCWACVWGFYGGVLRPMAHGLPDPTADSLFLACIVAVLLKRIWIYALAGSLVCLCRESYAAPAAALWIFTLTNYVDWGNCKNWWIRAFATAIPGAVVLGWAYYVAHQTNSVLLAGSRSIPWGGLIDWPFHAFYVCMLEDILSSNENEVIYATSCAICLVAVGMLVVWKARPQRLSVVLLPHILLMTMTGSIVWEAGVGFFKNTSSIVLIGVLYLPLHGAKLLRLALLFTFAAGLHYHYRADIRHQGFLPPLDITGTVQSPTPNRPQKVIPTRSDYVGKSELQLISAQMTSQPYTGIFDWFHRDAKTLIVRVKNTSETVWPASLPGDDAVTCGYILMQGEMVLHEQRLSMYKDVAPGESIDFSITVPSHQSRKSNKYVRIGLVHDGKEWFFWSDAKQKLDLPD